MKHTIWLAIFLMCSVILLAADFVDNGNETITDNESDLIWQKGEGGGMSWTSALSYCENSTLAGQNDWRLPNANELQTLVDYSLYSPVLDTGFFPGVCSSYYWSSSTCAGNTGLAWRVNFSNGNVNHYSNKSNNNYVRCVRGGQ